MNMAPSNVLRSSSSRLLDCKTNYMGPSGSRQLQAGKTGQPTRPSDCTESDHCIRASCGDRYRAHVHASCTAGCMHYCTPARARRRRPPALGQPPTERPRAAGVTPAQGRGCRSAAAGSPGRTRARPRARPAASATCARPAPRRARAWAPARARHGPALLRRSGARLRLHDTRMHTNEPAWRGAPGLPPDHPDTHIRHGRGARTRTARQIWPDAAGLGVSGWWVGVQSPSIRAS